jgi:16S rRNA A1518/A1519 N6-dimethyltransferase RsmA/KsgA/DIM1 with predicted DNA glycosylase/AP lyase activity
MAKIGTILKRELKGNNFNVKSVQVGEKSTGFAFNSGTKYKTITIVAENPYNITAELVYDILVKTKLCSNMFQAKSYTIIRKSL